MKIFYPTMDFDKVEDIPFEKFKKEGRVWIPSASLERYLFK